jgi:hypothetical protein
MSSNNVSEETKRILAFRQNLREQYKKIYQNPFNYKHVITDPAIARYEAARAYAKEYYKITPRSMAMPLGLIVFAYIGFRYVLKERTEKDRKIQNGETTYADRALYMTRYLY